MLLYIHASATAQGPIVEEQHGAIVEEHLRKIATALAQRPSYTNTSILDIITKIRNAVEHVPAHAQTIVDKTQAWSQDRPDVNIWGIIEELRIVFILFPAHAQTIVNKTEQWIQDRPNAEIGNIIYGLNAVFEEVPSHAQTIFDKTQAWIQDRPNTDIGDILSALRHTFKEASAHAQTIIAKTEQLIQGRANNNHIGSIIHRLIDAYQRDHNAVEDVITRILAQMEGRQDVIDDDIITMLDEDGQAGYFQRRALAGRRIDAYQVHKAASQAMQPIWKKITKELAGKDILYLDESKKRIHQWIDELSEKDASLFSPSRDVPSVVATTASAAAAPAATETATSTTVPGMPLEDIQKRLHEFLDHPSFKAALETTWGNLGADVRGATLLMNAVTYVSNHLELKTAFLVQGLWGAITAYVDNPKNLEQISCITGIAERFLTWALNLEIDFKASIVRDANPFFTNIDIHTGETKEQLAERKEKEIKDLQQSIKSKLLAQHPGKEKAIEEAFNNGDILYIFDPLTTAEHFEKAYDRAKRPATASAAAASSS